MRKSESILKMEELGLNTLDYRIIRDKNEALHYLAKHAEDKLSLRTERGTDFLCPFYYMMTGESLIDKALQHLSEGYALIFAPSLSIDGCLAFGNVALTGASEDVMEFVMGPGKVRDLDSHPDRQTVVISLPSMVPFKQADYGEKTYLLNFIYKKAKENCYAEEPCVVEWSYYNENVGRLSEKDIWWEIRPYA